MKERAVSQIVGNVLTSTKEHSTKAKPTSIPPKLAELIGLFETPKGKDEEALRNMSKAAQAFGADMVQAIHQDRGGRWLSLLGTSGGGKTFLAQILFTFMNGETGWRGAKWYDRQLLWTPPGATEPIDRGSISGMRRCVWLEWRSVCRRMKQGDFAAVNLVCDPSDIWFCVIDDLGAGDSTDRAYILNAISDIASARLGAWTLFTSNLFMDQLAALDTRIASRMIRGANVTIEIDVEDWNLRKSNPISGPSKGTNAPQGRE